MSINASEREAPALDARLQTAAKPLHGECPVCPHRAASLNSIGYVQKRVEGNWAGRKSVGGVLVIKSLKAVSVRKK